VNAAREAGKGAVLATGHFGNWEMIRVALARHGWPPALIYRAFNNPLFDDYAAAMMRVTDAPLFHKGRRGSLGMLRHIRAGGCTLILTDQRFSRAPEIPFFGKPAKTSLGPAEIAVNYGAVLLPVRSERVGKSSRFHVTVERGSNRGFVKNRNSISGCIIAGAKMPCEQRVSSRPVSRQEFRRLRRPEQSLQVRFCPMDVWFRI